MTTSSRRSKVLPHEAHDRFAIAALAAGDLSGTDRDRATTLVEACESCRLLLEDLRSISAAVRRLPPTETPRGRDFRLGARDAQRLTRRSGWRFLLRPFSTARGSVVRPMAATLMTLGLVGILVNAQPLLQFGAAGAARPEAAAAPIPATAMPDETGFGVLGPVADGVDTATSTPTVVAGNRGAVSSGGDAEQPSDGDLVPAPRNSDTTMALADRIPWLIVSVVALAAGVVLLLLRRVALRMR